MSSDIEKDDTIANLGWPQRLWVVGPCSGRLGALETIHDQLLDCVQPGEKIIYTGGYASASGRYVAVDEILLFRRLLLARDGFQAHDFVWLRGQEEEAFHRLFRLPYTYNPTQELAALLAQGAGRYLNYYGYNLPDVHGVIRSGLASLTRWIAQLRHQMRAISAHENFWLAARRAALVSRHGKEGPVLCVPRGFAPEKSLTEQGDSWWSDGKLLSLIQKPVRNFSRIIRGRDPAALGMDVGPIVLTLDDADGTTPVLAACVHPNGLIEEIISAAPSADEQWVADDSESATTPLPLASQFAARLTGQTVAAPFRFSSHAA
ncbi:MAG: hypothetical protein EBZ69_02400 [Alphaproteobacteria bacterium]|nr:hypothetical protein [Alphaproteobacteria bacterium]NDC55653.1 hypothetical protein [Alphaproteobacteria bacterium]